MERLTTREKQILEKLVRGWTNKEIGRALGISSRTAEDHRMHILKKSKVRNIVELVRAVYGIEEVA
jgi:FixJ family two-component response regulator